MICSKVLQILGSFFVSAVFRLDANIGIAIGQKKPVAKRENGANVYMLRSALLYMTARWIAFHCELCMEEGAA